MCLPLSECLGLLMSPMTLTHFTFRVNLWKHHRQGRFATLSTWNYLAWCGSGNWNFVSQVHLWSGSLRAFWFFISCCMCLVLCRKAKCHRTCFYLLFSSFNLAFLTKTTLLLSRPQFESVHGHCTCPTASAQNLIFTFALFSCFQDPPLLEQLHMSNLNMVI